MARKNLLESLMGNDKPARQTADLHAPRYSKGAIGAISRSVADLQARALIEIDASEIDPAGLQDRLETDPAEDEALRASIEEYGQQVPVLVRPHPSQQGRYQIVYGRRRVLALRDLGRPVKALVRNLDDRDLLLAQGQENTARRDLSFIEKANFARQMQEAGYDRKIIGDTLSMDKTLISRLLSVAETVPLQLIETIGAAPSVGRTRWLALAEAIEAGGIELDEVCAMVNLSDAETSDARFEAALNYIRKYTAKPKSAAVTEPQVITSLNGVTIAEVRREKGQTVLKFARSKGKGFDDWLLEALPELHRRYSQPD